MLYVARPMSSVTLCGFLLVTVSTANAAATDNAALAYWQAFAQLPSISEDLDKLVTEAPTVKLDDRTKELVNKSQGAVASMQRAASKSTCDWGLEYADGPHMVMPHLSKARQMARYACLHARQQLADGQVDKSLETIRNTFILARHTGADDVIIAALVQYAVEQIVIDTVCRELPKLDGKHLDTLAGCLDSLPAGSSISEALKLEEQIYVGWARRVVQDAKSDQAAVQKLLSIVSRPEEEKATEAVPFTRKQIAGWLEQTTRDYEELHAILDLPDDEFQPRWDALMERIRDENPYSAIVLPGVKSLREVRDRNVATWALFRAAIAVQRDGEQGLASVRDPFGQGPFKFTKLPAGFRLTSQLNFRGKPVELIVGPTATATN